MARVSVRRTWRERATVAVLFVTLTSFAPLSRVCANFRRARRRDARHQDTVTPIQHVIVLIGERNSTFDHLFATYVSPSGEHVRNLLSEGIVNADGAPGPRFCGRAVPGCPPLIRNISSASPLGQDAVSDSLPEPTSEFCAGR